MADEKPEDTPAASELPRVTDEGIRASFSGPAVRSNKIYLSLTPDGGARIAFLEQHGDVVPPIFRTAVILSFRDALSLRDLIARQLGQIEGLEEAMKAAEEAAEKAAESESKKEDGA